MTQMKQVPEIQSHVDRYKIALIDDHRILLDGLKWIIGQFNFIEQVDTFCGGEDLLDLIDKGNNYDLIITDIRMTPMSGLELLERIKKVIRVRRF